MKINAKLIFISILLVFISACSSWQKNAAVTYKSIAISLESSRNIANNLCLDGKIDIAKCSEIKEKYLIARDKFREAGDILNTAIDMSDELRQAKVDALLYQVNATLVWINEIIAEYQ